MEDQSAFGVGCVRQLGQPLVEYWAAKGGQQALAVALGRDRSLIVQRVLGEQRARVEDAHYLLVHKRLSAVGGDGP
jgi:hypothetical protein